MHKDNNHDKDEDIIINADSTDTNFDDTEDSEVVGEETLQAKLKKVRQELKTVQKEKEENLAGWQRAKADLVNYQRQVRVEADEKRKAAAEQIVLELLPVLDGFTMAMQGDAWHNVDASWRKGVEYIQVQLANVLKEHGLKAFGEIGEPFDPNVHESVSSVSTHDKQSDHTLAAVLQKGYTLHEKVVRPARVTVAEFTEAE